MAKHILIQVGHEHPREAGFEGGTGAAGEIEVVRKIGGYLEGLLRGDKNFTVRKIPGRFPPEIKSGAEKVDAFISLHCDGSGDPKTSFFSFGYPPGADHINKKLADLIAEHFEKIPHRTKRGRDNYTKNLSGYHGWSRVPTQGPEVLVEHDFVSHPQAREWLHRNFAKLAEAEHQALLDYFGLRQRRKLRAARPKDWRWARWYLGIGEYEPVGRRHKPSRPKYPRIIPARGWAAVRWYLKRRIA